MEISHEFRQNPRGRLGHRGDGHPARVIVLGSRNLEHFDAALVGYTFATLFAAFGITYRYAMWLQRPPTALLLAPGLAGVLPFLPSALPRRNLLLAAAASASIFSPTASSGGAASFAGPRTG